MGKVEPGQLVGLVTESQDGLDGDVHNHHTLGAEAKGQNLEGVGNEKTREAHVVKGGEEPDEDELGVAGARVGAVRVLVDGAADGPAHKGEAHAAGRDEEQGATAEAVDVHGGYDGDDEIVNGSTGAELLFFPGLSAKLVQYIEMRQSVGEKVKTYTKLLVLNHNTGTLVDCVHVVGEESVSTVLRNDTQRNENGQSPPVALGAEEVGVASSAVGLPLETHGLADLAKLELDRGVVAVAGAVVVGEHVEGLLLAVLGQ